MKVLAALLIILFANSALAQSPFYLKAGGGWGGTWTRETSFAGRSTSDIANAYHGAVSGGWQKGRWSIELGMGFSRTGGTTDGIYFEEDFDSAFNLIGTTPVPARLTLLHMHYTQPLSVGYRLPLSKRWAVQPRIGVEGVYNRGATERIRRESRLRVGGANREAYRMTYENYPLFGTAAVQLHCRVSPRIGLYSGFGYRWALTSLVRTAAGAHNAYGVRTASATVDAGVLFFQNANTRHISGPAAGEG